MVVEADYYRVRLRFKRLFADPTIFEDQENVVRRFIYYQGPPSDQTAIYQITDTISPTNKAGKIPDIAGTARYVHERRVVRSEYFENVILDLEYADYGSGLRPEDHQRLWKKQGWGRMSFTLEEFQNDHFKIDVPPILELYEIVSARGDPTSLVDVELSELPDKLFRATVGYLNNQLKQIAEKRHRTVEIYVARDLLDEEKKALEKRLTRPATESTIYILLSKEDAPAVI
jgi:hypothetical protein